MMMNVQSLLSLQRRLAYLNFFTSYNPDILLLSETWLDSNHPDMSVFPASNYNIISRSDRTNGAHGGVLLAANNSVFNSVDFTSIGVDKDFACACIITFHSTMLLIITVYNPPRSNNYAISPQTLSSCLSEYFTLFTESFNSSNSLHYETLILGDFNFPDIDWPTYHSTKAGDLPFLNWCQENNLQQVLSFPTHKQGNLLDIIIVTNTDIIEHIENPKWSNLSDHAGVLFQLSKSHYNTAVISNQQLAWSSFNPERVALSLPPITRVAQAIECMSLNDFSAEWTSMVHNAISSTVPRKHKKRAFRPFYYSSHTLLMLKKLETLERKKQKLNSIFNEEFLHATRNNFLESAELDKVVLLKDICWMSTSEAFKFLKRFSGKAPLPSKLTWETKFATDDRNKADLFNGFFASVFNPITTENLEPPGDQQPSIFLNDLNFDVKKVETLLSKCPDSHSQSSDGLWSCLYHNASAVLAPFAYILFSFVLSSCVWPTTWKGSYITPIFKVGSRSLISNYRPISIYLGYLSFWSD